MYGVKRCEVKRNGYRLQAACANCKHVFVEFEWDSSDTFHCTLGATKRPLCGSVAMHETFGETKKRLSQKKYDELFSRQMKTWERWSSRNRVQPHGICDKHEKGKSK
jgi:hypothetical protein